MGFWGTLWDSSSIPLSTDWAFGADPHNQAYKQIQGPQQYGYATNALGKFAQQDAPQVQGSQLNTANINQSRAGLNNTANNLSAIASGQQQGAGQIAVNRQVGQAQAQQAAQAQSARGGNSALAMRNAARNQADLGLAGAGQAAQAQQTDQLTANQQLAGIYGGMYGQDASVAAQNAQLAQQAQLANQQSTLQQRNLALGAYNQQLGWDQAQTNADIARVQAQQNAKGGFGDFAGAIGGIIGNFSDVRLKNNVADGQGQAMQAVNSLAPLTYAYNDQSMGQGPQLGTTAQDLERAGLAHTVIDTPQGKMVDGGKLSTANTAMIAALGNRLAMLENSRMPPRDASKGMTGGHR